MAVLLCTTVTNRILFLAAVKAMAATVGAESPGAASVEAWKDAPCSSVYRRRRIGDDRPDPAEVTTAATLMTGGGDSDCFDDDDQWSIQSGIKPSSSAVWQDTLWARTPSVTFFVSRPVAVNILLPSSHYN